MTTRFEIRAGKSKPCELVSITPTNWGGEAVNFVAEGTHTQCARIMAMLQPRGAA